MRAVENRLEDDDGNVLGEFCSHWGACAAMLGEERYTIVEYSTLHNANRPIYRLWRTKAEAEKHAEQYQIVDPWFIPERSIPEEERRYYK